MDSRVTFGERLTDLRTGKHLTQKALAQELNVGASTINDYENDKYPPPLDVFIRMSLLFDVSMDYLAGITDHNLRNDEAVRVLDEVFVSYKDKEISYGRIIETLASLDDGSRYDVVSIIDALIKGGRLNVK